MFGTTICPCPRDCPRRCADPNCHNAETCPEWAAHEARQKARKETAIARSKMKRMSWEQQRANTPV